MRLLAEIDELVTETTLTLGEVRRIWPRLVRQGCITSGEVAGDKGPRMSRRTALRRLNVLAAAGYIKADGDRGAQKFILIRRPDV